jgi:ribosomal protein L14E/L6E/L27E
MGDADITTSQWRLVELGRVVLFGTGPYEGRLATIVEIIDHKRVRPSPGTAVLAVVEVLTCIGAR